ncbi:hypothetical protein MtrunA17_Chr7g0240731 [Medicago truncatula]|uniref:Transmembrane protein n=1 Tax=Medicago truncatula TaxID=3880 RepID=A0A396GYT2_MEDTR|nr:hypothetical protein MtrunA17_Chr7g0240731 [Medicago truncatula]
MFVSGSAALSEVCDLFDETCCVIARNCAAMPCCVRVCVRACTCVYVCTCVLCACAVLRCRVWVFVRCRVAIPFPLLFLVFCFVSIYRVRLRLEFVTDEQKLCLDWDPGETEQNAQCSRIGKTNACHAVLDFWIRTAFGLIT